MLAAPLPLRFRHHALAVFAAAFLGSTLFALLSIGLILAWGSIPSLSWAVGVTVAIWIAIFLIALPGTAILFSLLWPVTRHGRPASAWICVIAGATLGVVLAPFSNPGLAGASATQIVLLAVTGAALGALYVLFCKRLATSTLSRRGTPRTFRHRLPATNTAGF